MCHIEFNKVTWYSKLAAVVLFVCVFNFAFYLGMQYQLVLTLGRQSLPTTSLPTRSVPTASGIITGVNDVTLSIGQTEIVKGLHITLHAIVEDSRCPIDVRCFVAGLVKANVTLENGPRTETHNIMLSSGVPQLFDSYRITIINVAPPREYKKEISQSEYRITFHVEEKEAKGFHD